MEQGIDQKILALIQEKTSFERGFKLLMDTYQEKLYRHVRRMVNEHEDTNDVLQNVMIKVYKSIERFEGKSSLYTWLYRIATNETLTFIKSKKRKETSSIDNEDLGLDKSLRADHSIDSEEVQYYLNKAIEQLPEKQKLVFNMRYFDEMSYDEISKVLDTSVGALKASYHHAVKKIEAFINQADII